MTPFIDFGRKTMYSLKNAMGTTKTILPILKERGQKYFAVSDYGEVSGWVNQLFTCKDNDIVPILGMETFVNNYRFRLDGDKTVVHKMSLTDDVEKEDNQFKDDELDYAMIDFPLDLFARTIDGYYNIIQIHNEAQINGVDKRPRITEAYLKTHGKGVVTLLPSPYSEIATLVYNGYENDAISKLKAYQHIFDDVYMEITILEDEDYKEINSMLVQFCKKHQVKMIPVINSHYDLKEDGEVFPIFQKCGKLRGGFSYESDFAPNMYYKTAEEVFDTFKKFHESKNFTELDMQMMFMNLERLCKTFTLLDIDTSPKLPKMENSAEKLKELAWQGMERLGYKGKKEYEDRLNMELDNVIGVGFADYFLMLYGLFDWHINKKHRLPSVGRGSASSSLILNCLNITHIDPLKYELPFERFLSVDKLKEIIKQGGKIKGCFHKNTMVKTNCGIKMIQNIQVGDVIETIDGSYKKVLNVWNHGVKSFNRVIYKKENNFYEIYVTSNHIFPTIENGNVVDTELFNMNKSSVLLEDISNFATIVKIEKDAINGEAYDLSIEDKHYYKICGKKINYSL